MADIDQIIASGAKTTADFDFNKIVQGYWEGKDQAAKNRVRDAFSGGVPTTPDGSPDFAAMSKTLFEKGDLQQGVAAANLGIQRDQLRMGQQAADRIGAIEGGAPVPAPAPTSFPPSTSRNASAVVGKPISSAGSQPSTSGAAPGQGTTIAQVLTAQGIPNDQIGAASASVARQMGISDPNAPIDVNDPQVRNVLVPAVQQLKRMGVGQVIPEGQPSPPPQVVPQPGQPTPVAGPQPVPAPAAPNPQVNQGTFGAPSAVSTRGAIPTGTDPEIQKQVAMYTSIASNPVYPKSVQEAALSRLKALQEQGQPTGPMKEYDLARRQGYQGTLQDYTAESEAKKTAATEEAKLGAQKYQTLVESGVKAQQEIPQLEMLQEQMNDPNFYSGIGEKYNLLAKRLQAAVGMNPDAAVPQEFLRKATAASVLSSFGALKGLGPIRVAEMNLAKQAAAAPENSIPANKLLVEIQKRTYQRQGDIAEMAQAYKEKNGVLDTGFDKQVTAYFKANPIFTDAEVKDYHKAIGEAPAAAKPGAGPATPSFSSPSEVHAAVAAGKLKKGDAFTAMVDGKPITRYVP
jgi:hypothetical protein